MQATPNQCLPVNVQVVIGEDRDNGRQILHFWDWYYYRKRGESGYWWGADLHGLLDQLLWDENNEIIAIKQGRTIGNKRFNDILKKAMADSDFLIESARNKLNKPKQVYGKGVKDG